MATHFKELSQWTHRQTTLARAHGRTTSAIIAELQQEPAVETAEPNYLRGPEAQPPNDSFFPQLWGLSNSGQEVNGFSGSSRADIRFVPAWALARPSTSNVVVAVVDSGMDYHHPDLAANMWTNPGETPNNGIDDDHNGYIDDYYGYDFVDNVADPKDSGFHGTHVSGTIAAVGNNHLGVIGVDFQARIMALKVSNNGSNFIDSAIISAIPPMRTRMGMA
jgi:subtilisin family serine protease